MFKAQQFKVPKAHHSGAVSLIDKEELLYNFCAEEFEVSGSFGRGKLLSELSNNNGLPVEDGPFVENRELDLIERNELNEKILNYLKEKGGTMELDSKSSAESVKEVFGVSRKVFKKALGALYKKKLIDFADGVTRLL